MKEDQPADRGPDEPKPAPAKADEAAAGAPDAGAAKDSKSRDWMGVLTADLEKRKEGAAKPTEKAKGRAGGALPPVQPEDGEIDESDEGDVSDLVASDVDDTAADESDEDQSGPSDGADAGQSPDEGDEVSEPELPPEAEVHSLRSRLKEKEESEAQLIELKGRLGERIGILTQQLQERQPIDERTGERKPLDDEQMKELVNEEIAEMMGKGPKAMAREVLVEMLEEARQLQERNERASAPDVAFREFRKDFTDRIGTDPVSWAKGPEGQAVKRILDADPILKDSWSLYQSRGDATGLKRVLTRAMRIHLSREKGNGVVKSRVETRRRIEAKKPVTLPGSPRRRPATGGTVNLHDPSQWKKVLEMTARSQR